MDIVQEASELLTMIQEIWDEDPEWRDKVKESSQAVQDAFWKLLKKSQFLPENADLEARKEHQSPSGKYRLVVTPYKTGPNSWNYSLGQVYEGDHLIAEVYRNYSAFPFLWVESHPNRHSYLVCGEDYQGQTVIELDTDKRRDNLSKGTDNGWGFCWAKYRFDEPSNILVVDGCVWACPYEFKFFDFSDPMNGWPEIENEDMCIYADNQQPDIRSDTIKTYDTSAVDDNDIDDDGNQRKDLPIRSIKTFKRDGVKLIFVEEWVSEEEKVRRVKRDEAEKRYEEKTANFKATDPLYLAYVELVKDPSLSPEEHQSVGITYEGWCPDFKEQEQRWCRRIVNKGKEAGYTVDLEWATVTGPIKLIIYKDGNTHETKWFEHSVKGMNQAFEYTKGLVAENAVGTIK